MGREVRIASKGFDWPLNKTWWGYLLPPVLCQSCDGTGEGCVVCEGERKVYPQVEPPAYTLDSLFGRMYRDDRFRDRFGWQMWETVSEGSPISPVCDTPEILAHWLANNEASSFGSMTATYEQWLGMIGKGWAPSAEYSPSTGIISGVEAVSKP